MNKLNDEKLIKNIMAQVFGESRKVIAMERLGGLTNRSYAVFTVSDKYVVRLPGEGTEEIINRREESISTELACRLGIDAKLYFFDAATGIKVSEYIENSRTMHQQDMQKKGNLILAAEVLKKLHNSGEDTKVPFDVIEMAEVYENYILKNGGSFYEDYAEVKELINKIRESYLKRIIKKPCHNDPLCENWILKKKKMYLVDWEYAGMNDPMWDLADVSIEAGLSREMDEVLLKAYLGKEPSRSDWKGFRASKVLIDYLWSLWGKTMAINDNEMEQYALERYQRMKKNRELL